MPSRQQAIEPFVPLNVKGSRFHTRAVYCFWLRGPEAARPRRRIERCQALFRPFQLSSVVVSPQLTPPLRYNWIGAYNLIPKIVILALATEQSQKPNTDHEQKRRPLLQRRRAELSRNS